MAISRLTGTGYIAIIHGGSILTINLEENSDKLIVNHQGVILWSNTIEINTKKEHLELETGKIRRMEYSGKATLIIQS